jgi:CMP-N-acetylneuraminic acid synthetase
MELCGKPMMNYSIEAALEAACFDRIILSTDSVKYGKIGEKCGAEVMYRDESLASDTATTYMVLEDLFSQINHDFDYFVLLQPTSPLRTTQNIKEAIEVFERNINRFDFLVSMKVAEHNHLLVKPVEEDMSLKHFDADFANYRRQGVVDYSPNGAIFIGKVEPYLKQKHFFGARAIGYIMNDVDSIDVDNTLDYRLASLCMEERLKAGHSNG